MIIPNGLLETGLTTSDLDRPVYYGPDKTPYTGPIFRISTGAIFTGPSPNNNSQPLYYLSPSNTRVNPADVYNNKITDDNNKSKNLTTRSKYINLHTGNNQQYVKTLIENGNFISETYSKSNFLIPKPIDYKPNEVQYITGSYFRFIVKMYSNNSFYFTNRENYRSYLQAKTLNENKVETVYTIVPIRWFIRARSRNDVITINEYNIKKLESNSQVTGLSNFIIDYDQYYSPINDNLYTGGGELLNKYGNQYKGTYFIDSTNRIFERNSIKIYEDNELFLVDKTAPTDIAIQKLSAYTAVNYLINKYTINNNVANGSFQNDNIDTMRVFKAQAITNLNNSVGGSSGGGGGY